MNAIYLNGKITLDEQDQSRMNYIINNASTGKEVSITNILDTIYSSKNTMNKLVRIAGKVSNSNKIFNGFNSLYITKGTDGIFGYHVGNLNLEKILYQLAENGDFVEMVIEDYTESTKDLVSVEDVDYETKSKAV